MFIIYVCKTWDFIFPKGVVMYSQEFMRFLIKYQTPDYDESVDHKVINFRFGLKTSRLAAVLLVNKK